MTRCCEQVYREPWVRAGKSVPRRLMPRRERRNYVGAEVVPLTKTDDFSGIGFPRSSTGSRPTPCATKVPGKALSLIHECKGDEQATAMATLFVLD
jgi:hypothetical protein